MNKIGLEYGNWLSSMSWTHIATIRRHYPITELNADAMFIKPIKRGVAESIFYAVEPDMNDNHTHAHLLINSQAKLSRKKLAQLMNMQPQSISYFEKVISNKAVSYYCTKNLTKKALTHNFLI